jgi:4-amino-4-deoxy-L-arabinose transferase-like glycosyltransferase
MSSIAAAARCFLEERPKLCASLLILFFTVLCAVSTYHNTPTYDEPGHLPYGESLLNGTLDHCDMQRMPITALNALPQKLLKLLHVSVSPETGWWLARLPTVICAGVLGWFIFAWSFRLYGSKGGLLSLLLFTFCPTSLAHGGLVTTDMYCAAFSFFAVFAFAAYLKARSWRRLLIAGVLMGVAQLTKHTALLLFPVLLTVFILREYVTRRDHVSTEQPWRGRLRKDALHALAYLLLALAVINAGYRFRGTFENLDTHRKWLAANHGYPTPAPRSTLARGLDFLVSHAPLPLPRPYVEAALLGEYYNATGGGHGPIYLLGKLGHLGWRRYFPVAFVLKTPLPTLAIILLASFVCLRTRRLRLASDELLLVLSAAAPFVFLTLFCTAQLGVRYLLPVLPSLYTFAGQIAIWSPAIKKRLWNAGLLVLLLWLPVSVSSYFPHYISYFNETCWNRLRLYKYLADSNLDWGQDGYYLNGYLRAHKGQSITKNPSEPTTGTIIVNVNNLIGPEYQWLRNNYSPTSRVAYSWLVYQIPAPPKE